MPTPHVPFVEYPAGDAVAPTFLVFPGGGYDHLAAHEGEPVAHWLNELGLHAAVVPYRVGGSAWPGALHDARDALAALKDGDTGLRVDRRRIGVIGFSAGGHLAGLLATDSPDLPGTERWRFAGRPDAAILAYPLIELRDSFAGRIANPDAEAFPDLVGDDVDPDLLSQLSVASRVTSPDEEAMPSILVWTTSDDDVLHPMHTVSLMTSLAVAGVPFEGHVFASGDHGLGLARDDPSVGQWRRLAANWLDDLGWLPDPA